MPDSPKIENAPGLVWRRRNEAWAAIWQARTDLRKAGFTPKTVQLWSGIEPSEADQTYIRDQCTRLQDAMLVWSRGGIEEHPRFDGTLIDLSRRYQTDPDSNFKKLRFNTRNYYTALLKRIEKDHGEEIVEDIKARNLLRWHEDLVEQSGVAMGHSVIGMLRTLFGFGATILEDDECERLCAVMHKMRFKVAKPREERLTAEHVVAIIAEANRRGWHSVALAQAIQFECMLRQKDVIGEWVPHAEPGVSDVTSGGEKWLRGIRWTEIDKTLVLRHVTSKRQKEIEVDLKLAPMVLAELQRLGDLPASGPVIVSEFTGLPWYNHIFRRRWRQCADAVGVPKNVRNMDSRAGAISEATDAGAELEHVRHAATHGDIAMTQRYSRNQRDKTDNVMNLRAAHRTRTR